MRNELLGTLRLSIIDNLRAEIREREGVIADLTRSDEIASVPDHAKLSNGDLAFVDTRGDTHVQRSRPTHGDAIAEVRKRGRKAKGKRVRRSAEDIEAMGKKLLAYVTKHPGQRGEQIAKALGTDVGTMRKPMKSLGYLIRTKGKRRGTTYFAK